MIIENKSHFKLVYSNEKKFGYLFSFIFLLVSLYYYIFENKISIFFIILTFLFIIISIFFSKFLIYPNKIWIKFGLILNYIISPIVMLMIFLITFYPIGILLKLLKFDILNLKYDNTKQSYWIKRKNKMESLRRLY